MVARTVASPAPISSSSAVCTRRCTYSESQFTISTSAPPRPRLRSAWNSLPRFQFSYSFDHLLQLNSSHCQRRFQPLNNFLGRPAATYLVSGFPFLRRDILCQPVLLLLQPHQFRRDVNGLNVRNPQVE